MIVKSLIIFGLMFNINVYAQDKAKGEVLFKACMQCHGDKGQGLFAEKAPKIAGQYDWYLVNSLKAFKTGKRKNPKMLPFIKDLSENDFIDLAAYISTLE